MSANESSQTSSLIDECWINWFCGLNGNQFFCEVEKGFIEDSFNLFGLKHYVSKDFNKVLDTILDRLEPDEADSEDLSRSAALLYGMIHARYIVSSSGLEAMRRKYMQKDFGECQRWYCFGQAVVPVGLADEPKQGNVKLFCPRCQDVYCCGPAQKHVDGAFFGTTFPHLFFMTHETLAAMPLTERYVPKVFGFQIHPSSNSLPLSWLQQNHGVSSRFTVSAEDLIPSAAPPARAGLEEQEDKEDDDQRLSDSPKNLLELRSSSVSASGMIRRKRVVSGSIREDIKGTGLKFNIDSEERVGDLGEANSNGTLQQPNSASKSDTIKSRKRSAGSVDDVKDIDEVSAQTDDGKSLSKSAGEDNLNSGKESQSKKRTKKTSR